jgi:hypothetical protein
MLFSHSRWVGDQWFCMRLSANAAVLGDLLYWFIDPVRPFACAQGVRRSKPDRLPTKGGRGSLHFHLLLAQGLFDRGFARAGQIDKRAAAGRP